MHGTYGSMLVYRMRNTNALYGFAVRDANEAYDELITLWSDCTTDTDDQCYVWLFLQQIVANMKALRSRLTKEWDAHVQRVLEPEEGCEEAFPTPHHSATVNEISVYGHFVRSYRKLKPTFATIKNRGMPQHFIAEVKRVEEWPATSMPSTEWRYEYSLLAAAGARTASELNTQRDDNDCFNRVRQMKMELDHIQVSRLESVGALVNLQKRVAVHIQQAKKDDQPTSLKRHLTVFPLPALKYGPPMHPSSPSGSLTDDRRARLDTIAGT
jgi:hypothetical protein